MPLRPALPRIGLALVLLSLPLATFGAAQREPLAWGPAAGLALVGALLGVLARPAATAGTGRSDRDGELPRRVDVKGRSP